MGSFEVAHRTKGYREGTPVSQFVNSSLVPDDAYLAWMPQPPKETADET